MGTPFDFEYEEILALDTLDQDIQELIQKAELQLDLAYAPYSEFYVGAAVLSDSGTIYPGCNQENASYPIGLCAESVALYNLGSYEKAFKIKALAITAHNPHKALSSPCMPCGSCRQVIQEFEMRQNHPITMYLSAKNVGTIKVEGIRHLLPNSFSKDDLF